MSSGRGMNHLNRGVNNLSLGATDDGAWETVPRRQNNNRGRRNAANQWPEQAPQPRAWTQPDTARRLGLSNNNAPNNNPTRGGYGSRQNHGNSGPSGQGRNRVPNIGSSVAIEDDVDEREEEVSDDDDDVYSEGDDDLLSDDYDSDEIPTHESKKQHKMLKAFFDVVDKLTVEQVTDPDRQWHCPACQDGPGAIDWYNGLQPLAAHAKTKGSVRVKLHRMFEKTLQEELRRKGTSVVPAGSAFAMWEALGKVDEKRVVVWPPMVVITNTVLEKDDNDKWLGMGNQELLEYFKDYDAVRAKHAYGPRGHRGMSVLIFDESAMGFMEAERLHKHFIAQGTGRNAWDSNRKVLFKPGGKRQLYGYLAEKYDIEDFNKHCTVKTRLKYEMKLYKEKVLDQMKQMSEDNQQLTWYKSKHAKDQGRKKVLEESLNIVTDKLRKTMEENRIVRQRTTMQHEENKEEMDFQEQFFNDQIQKIHDATTANENKFEKFQQEERKKIELSKAQTPEMDDLRQWAEKVSKFKEFQAQEMEKFAAERDEMMRAHERKKVEMKKKHWEEELQLEKDCHDALTNLMSKYAPGSSGGGVSGGTA